MAEPPTFSTRGFPLQTVFTSVYFSPGPESAGVIWVYWYFNNHLSNTRSDSEWQKGGRKKSGAKVRRGRSEFVCSKRLRIWCLLSFHICLQRKKRNGSGFFCQLGCTISTHTLTPHVVAVSVHNSTKGTRHAFPVFVNAPLLGCIL